MTSWATAALSRSQTALTIAVDLALGVAACSDGSHEEDRPSAATSKTGSGSAPREHLQTDESLAELQDRGGLSFTITSAERESRSRSRAQRTTWSVRLGEHALTVCGHDE
ncbi:hypothetical protein [Streptomyces bobili]|uniref:hypothetical protein n=1 Tax=Streptomyces bobili TaxID=67280 RepID=UPI00371158EB